jgi:hypothetical protein
MSSTSQNLHRNLCRFRCLIGFLFGLVPIVAGCADTLIDEVEPNSTTATATVIRQFEIGDGDITPVGDVDVWRSPRATAGQLIFAYVDTSLNPGDSFLRVLSNSGAVIEFDDDDGPGLSSVVAGAVVPEAGNVFYEITHITNSQTITEYRFYHAIIDPADSMSDAASEPSNNAFATAPAITAPLVVGNLFGEVVDFYKISALQNDRFVVMMDNDPEKDGMSTHTVVDILDTDGMTILTNGAGGNNGGVNANAAGTAVAPAPGTYFVRVMLGSPGQTNYRFVLLVNGVPYADRDADTIPDYMDNCPTVANAPFPPTDTDGDTIGDACDTCPMSILKTAPGVCGCDQPDVDVNGDGTVDCNLADPARALLRTRGLLLVPDNTTKAVMAFDPTTGDLVDPAFIPSDATHISTARAAILSANGQRVLVVDTSTHAVHAYDLAGNYLGIFAPAGGVNTMILNSPTCLALRPNGNLLVDVGAGANMGAVAEFDTSGNYVGNFIANGAGGLGFARSMHFHAGAFFVTDGSASMIRRYNADTGAFINDFSSIRSGRFSSPAPPTAACSPPPLARETTRHHRPRSTGLWRTSLRLPS